VAAEENGLVIAGEPLEVDLVDVMARLDVDEAQVLYDISGVVQEDFVPPHPEASKSEHKAHEEHVSKTIRNPAFKRAVTCIAYMRKHPDADLETVRELDGKVRQIDVSLALAGGDEVPPDKSSPSEPEKLKPSGTHSRSEDSGKPSMNGSDQPAESREPTGTSESVTSSPALAPTT
jgi:hypothetical protein